MSILSRCESDLEKFEVERLLSGKYDKFGCTVCINSMYVCVCVCMYVCMCVCMCVCLHFGVEAADWAGMLYRMYKRFAERKGYKIVIMEEMNADFGIKSVEMQFHGDFAYGYLAGQVFSITHLCMM